MRFFGFGHFSSLAFVAAAHVLVHLQLHVNVAQAADILVLIHGLGGWGPDEFLGFPYWSYSDILEDEGLTIKTVAIGKFTSNWDRACEVYAQLKGTVVDYGVCHSQSSGHARFGKDYTGKALYPQWDGSNRVHLMGHSMGGQTMRVLERLLQRGSGCAQDTSPLFVGGGKNWIRSITSVSGTLDGTSFVDIMGDDFSDFIRDLVVALAAISDGTFIEDLYDVDMSQWGIERLPGESFSDFWDRAVSSGVASSDNPDFSMYELSQVGAREMNDQTQPTYSGTYYFAIATERTDTLYWCFFFDCHPYETPNILMIPFLWFSASVIGSSDQPREKQKNDGLVNWYNQICPTDATHGKSLCEEYSGTWNPSKWYYLNVPTLDHLQIILPNTLTDIFNYNDGPKKVYTDHARRLKSLPGSTQFASSTTSNGDEVLAKIEHLTELSKKTLDDNRRRKVGIAVNAAVGTVLSVFVALSVAFLGHRYIRNKRGSTSQTSNEIEGVKGRSASARMVRQSSVSHYIVDDFDVPELSSSNDKHPKPSGTPVTLDASVAHENDANPSL